MFQITLFTTRVFVEDKYGHHRRDFFPRYTSQYTPE